jgi:hypothetical protein
MLNLSTLNPLSSADQLSTLLGSGSTQGTTSANDAFAALLQQLLASQSQAQNTLAPAATTRQSSVSTDMNALSQALSSGNLSAAQQAFQSLQADLQGTQQAGHHHHHHHHQGSATTDSAQSGASTQATSGAQVTPASASNDSSSDSQLLSLFMGMAQPS